jgi:uncharacterized circularly permuted ATP-grasp superfamily protein
VVNSSQGGGTKDTWVLAPDEANPPHSNGEVPAKRAEGS